ncbi:MAG TPA: FAD-dependent oxidoreductase [Bryobacteraceae bacterium]|jgi:NADPH-dependent 2,4-dienoyl-CoA reductase/sulfur reductase-like enzyme
MTTLRYVILGGGMVAGYCAKELVERGLKPGELTIISSDDSVPYERPPLSKGFLAGKDSEDGIRINPEKFYGEHGIDVKLGSEATAVNTGRKILHLRSGQDLLFDNLVIATGARVRTLSLPGSDLPGLYYLRSLDDSKRIRKHAEGAKRAAVIGGSFIAMEVASVLAQRGVETTMILRDDRIWKQFFTPSMSRFFENYYSAHGVKFVKEAKVEALRGKSGVESVALGDNRSIPCDLVVAGVGVRPVTEPVSTSLIEVTDGIVVNEFLETAVPGIFAAGDVANYRDTMFGTRRRVEHWDNAVSQGQHCARILTGERAPFVHLPYFFSDVFDLSYEFWGDPAGADEVVERGDLSSKSFSVWWLSKERLVAMFAMNRSDEERDAAQKWIAQKQLLIAEKLRSAASVHDAEKLSTLKAG